MSDHEHAPDEVIDLESHLNVTHWYRLNDLMGMSWQEKDLRHEAAHAKKNDADVRADRFELALRRISELTMGSAAALDEIADICKEALG